MRKMWLSLFSVLLVASMFLTACGPTATPTAAPTEAPTEAATEAATPEPTKEATPEPTAEPVAEPVEIRWFIGLGAGGNTEEIAKEEAFVEKFNAKYGDKYVLVMDVVQNATAYDVLKTQIASGDVPDIVGPVGVRGFYSFEGAWMDLAPYIEKSKYDLSDFNPALIDFYKFTGQGQVGLPFAVYPSALWYNKALFDEAGLEYPPHVWGDKYADGDDWDFEKMKELAIYLTVDANGNTPTDAGFDPDNIMQFGYNPMWTDIRGKLTFFEAGNFVDDKGNAVVSDAWRDGIKWLYAATWDEYFFPNANYVNSDLLAQGNTFSSGNVAMNPNHTWYTCCAGDVDWDVAAIPSYNGHITAKLHADTFGILKGTENPDAAFEVLGLMLDEFAGDLAGVYGAFPARESLQEDALAAMAEKFPGVDLNVFVEGLNYPDNPNHEAGMPNFLKASDRYASFDSLLTTTPGLDVDAEIDLLIKDLQVIYDEVQ